MLVRISQRASQADLDSILRLCNELGFEPRFLDDGRRILELAGSGTPQSRSLLEDQHAVEQIIDAAGAPELHARPTAAGPREDTVVRVGEARFGGGLASLIAGPCAVEDGERLIEIARAVRSAGALVLRGGAFKPRTSPYSFQGLGAEGLERLAHARAETGIAVVTEVLDPRDLERVDAACDMFQIGSRSMNNFPLLREVGQTRKPVLLKRGMAATAREFLLAAEYVLAGGNENVVLCERGVRGFDSVTRNLLDVGIVAHLKRATHLPVIVDPSHAAGRADLVPALARAGLAAGADGLLVEVHPEPSEVHSDGAQAVSLDVFRTIAAEARELLAVLGRQLQCADLAAPSEPRGKSSTGGHDANGADPARIPTPSSTPLAPPIAP